MKRYAISFLILFSMSIVSHASENDSTYFMSKLTKVTDAQNKSNYRIYALKKSTEQKLGIINDNQVKYQKDIEENKNLLIEFQNQVSTQNQIIDSLEMKIVSNNQIIQSNFKNQNILHIGILLFVLALMTILFYLIFRKTNHNFIHFKEEIDLEIQSIEKEFIRENRNLKKEMNKRWSNTKNFETINKEFGKKLEEHKEEILNQISKLKGK